MKLTNDNILVETIEYNRNGISGEGFYSMNFYYQNSPLIAIVNETDLTEEYGYTRVYVIDPVDLTNKWRGDNFGKVIISLITEFEKSRRK